MDWLFKLYTIAKDLIGHLPQDINDWLVVGVIAILAILISYMRKNNAWTALGG